MEFISLASIMLVVTVGFFAITSSKILESQDQGNSKIAEDIANFAYREIEIAKSTQDGYTRLFTMPETVNGVLYTINITDNRELIVTYLDYEYIRFLAANVTGNVSRGLNKISKLDGIIYLTSFKVIIPPPLVVLLMKDPSNNAVSFDDQGNVTLRGTLQQNQAALIATASDEFILKDSSGNIVAIINLNDGNMYIKGTLFQKQSALNPPAGNNFVVKSSSGNVILYIDENGNFYLKGTVKQNGNP